MTEQSYAPARQRGEDHTLALVGHVLLLTGGFTGGVTSIIGVVMAYAKRDTADAVAASHFRLQIKTFWIGFIGMLISAAVMTGGIITAAVGGAVFASTTSPAPEALTPVMIAGIVAAVIGGIGLGIVGIWVFVLSIYGLIKLSSDQPVGA